MKTLVLLSGGLDSFVLSALARENSEQLYGLTFDYQQMNDKEIECAKNIAEYFGFKDHIIMKLDFGQWRDKYLDTTLVKSAKSQESKSAYVPARNLIFLSYAVGIATSIGIDNIAIGTTISDFGIPSIEASHGYPDCHPDFLKAFQRVTTLLSNEIRIFAPFTNSTKVDIIRYGSKKNLDFGLTWSCYSNSEKPCGKCMACKNRIIGFGCAGQEDILSYQEDFKKLFNEVKQEWGIND